MDEPKRPFADLSFGTKIDCVIGSIGGRPTPMYDLGRDADDSRGCFDADDDEDDWGADISGNRVVKRGRADMGRNQPG